MKRIKLITFLVLNVIIGNANSSHLKCAFLQIEIDSSQTTNLIIRNDEGIDSLDFNNLKHDFLIIDTTFYSENGLVVSSERLEKIICVIYKLSPLRTGKIECGIGKLYLKSKVYELRSSNSLLVRSNNESIDNEEIFSRINLFNLIDTSDNSNIELIKKQFSGDQPQLISYTEKGQYKIGDTVRIYYASNQGLSFELKDNFNTKSLKILSQVTKKNYGYEATNEYAYQFLIFHFIALERSIVTIPQIKAKLGRKRYQSKMQTITIE